MQSCQVSRNFRFTATLQNLKECREFYWSFIFLQQSMFWCASERCWWQGSEISGAWRPQNDDGVRITFAQRRPLRKHHRPKYNSPTSNQDSRAAICWHMTPWCRHIAVAATRLKGKNTLAGQCLYSRRWYIIQLSSFIITYHTNQLYRNLVIQYSK